VHTLAVHLAPILAAEKSKAPFYIAGGLLVAWALFVSLGLGLRNPDFPGNLGGQRIVSAITAVLVIAAVSTAVITSGGESKAEGKPPKQESYGANTPDTAAPESANGSAGAGASASAETTSSAATPAPAPAKSTPTASAPRKSAPAKKTKTSPKATTGTPAPPSSPAATATTLKLAANPAGQLLYDKKTLSAKAGKVTIDFANTSPVEHDVAIAQGSTVAGQTPVFTGGSKTLTLNLKPGTYAFYCTVPGHRQAGMEGTLTVS
jgi:plastocyanin